MIREQGPGDKRNNDHSTRICFFNLVENFYPFFIPLANHLEAQGIETWFFNFWPGEVSSLRLNGKSGRIVDWKSHFSDEQGEVSEELINRWMSSDPTVYNLNERDVEQYRDAYKHLLPAFRRVLQQYSFDAVFFWNGYKFPEPALQAACEEQSVGTFYGENGFFANTMQIDPVGVNSGSSLAERSAEEWFDAYPESEDEFQQFFTTGGCVPLQGNPVSPVKHLRKSDRIDSLVEVLMRNRRLYSPLPRQGLTRRFFGNLKEKRIKAGKPSSRGVPLPNSFIFLPFQVHDDTQITVNSPWIKDMEAFVNVVKAVAQQLRLPHAIVVKEHPVDVGRKSYDNLSEHSDVVWLWDYPLNELLARAACVITVNSSVGLEAVVHGKPVITLGNAVYNVPGVVYHAASDAELADALTAAITQAPDQVLRNRFLCKLAFQDMVRASWKRPTDIGIANAGNRIVSLLEELLTKRNSK